MTGGIGADELYWEALERGHFRLPRCAGCQRWIWPAHYRCGSCGCWDQEWIDVDPVGTVYTWTRTWYAFDRVMERADTVPYVVVLAELPHADDVRVLGVLDGPEEGLAIGAPVFGRIAPAEPASKGYATIRWVLDARAEPAAETTS